MVGSLLFVAVLVAAVKVNNRYFLAGTIIAMGLISLVSAITRDEATLHQRLRHTRGPGWWIGWLISKVPGVGAKVLWSLLSLGIVAFGIAELAARHSF